MIWYSSDLFYWIILIIGFKYKKNQSDSAIRTQSTSCNSRSSLDEPLLNNETAINETYHELQLTEEVVMKVVNETYPVPNTNRNIVTSIKYFISLFEYMGKNLEEYFEFSVRFRNFNFQKTLKIIGTYFLIMAFLKFFLSTYEFLLLTYHLINVDMRSFDISRTVKLDDFLKN